MAEELVPRGLPHGSRQQVVSQARQVGVPVDDTAPTSTGLRSDVAPTQPPPQPRPPSQSFDVLQSRQPTQPIALGTPDPPSPSEQIAAALATSANSFYRALASEIQ